jgi:hypothetical protein
MLKKTARLYAVAADKAHMADQVAGDTPDSAEATTALMAAAKAHHEARASAKDAQDFLDALGALAVTEEVDAQEALAVTEEVDAQEALAVTEELDAQEALAVVEAAEAAAIAAEAAAIAADADLAWSLVGV